MGDNIFADHSNEANNHRNDDVLEGGLRVPERYGADEIYII